MIKLNDESIYVGHIKQILHSFNLPMFPVYQEGSIYAIGEHYLRDDAIYFINESKEEERFRLYEFGDFVDGLTTKMPISSNIYDSQTHIYLGNYLRFLRDYLHFDLMSMYNCCGYDSPRDFNATYNDEIEFNSDDPKYTLIMIPVRYGHKYTIGIDYHGALEMACMHFENNQMLDKDKDGNPIMMEKTYYRTVGARFNHPFIYDKLFGMRHDKDTKERTLKLFIKIPTSCSSSIVVLEGDYANCSNENMYMDGFKQKLGDSFLSTCNDSNASMVNANYDYVSKNQLLSMNLGQKALLADRLVEYLSKQAIAPDNDVVDNIKRLQRTLLDKVRGFSIKQYGVWDDSMREAIYRYIWSNGSINNGLDMLSYFDKDVEKRIGGLLTKYRDQDNKKKTFTNGEVGGR